MNPGEFVDLRVLRWEVPLEILRARYTRFEFPTHAHAEFTICEVLQGSERFAHLGREVEAPTGWFIHINPAEAHNGRAGLESWTYVACYPGLEFMRWALPELCAAGEPRFSAPVSRRPALEGALASLVRRAFHGADDLELQSGMCDFLHWLLQPRAAASTPGATHESRRSAAVKRIRDRLSDEWDRNLSLSELAASVSLSPLTLLRSFRDEVGCTPQVYRTARRLAVARQLVRDGAELSTVALRCGFTDQSHFTNTFRKWTGVTPGQYRAVAGPSRRSA
jgi:AraC-like DNA-binding protein